MLYLRGEPRSGVPESCADRPFTAPQPNDFDEQRPMPGLRPRLGIAGEGYGDQSDHRADQ